MRHTLCFQVDKTIRIVVSMFAFSFDPFYLKWLVPKYWRNFAAIPVKVKPAPTSEQSYIFPFAHSYSYAPHNCCVRSSEEDTSGAVSLYITIHSLHGTNVAGSLHKQDKFVLSIYLVPAVAKQNKVSLRFEGQNNGLAIWWRSLFNKYSDWCGSYLGFMKSY